MVNIKKTLEYTAKAIKIFTLANAVYFCGFMIVANGIHRQFAQHIKSQSGLELILKDERKKLSLKDSIKINVNLNKDKKHVAHSKKLGDKDYEISLSNDTYDITTLRHELYHIADGHFESQEKIDDSFQGKFIKSIKYLYHDEPKAILYHMTGIKL